MRAVKGVLAIALRARAEGKVGSLAPPDRAAAAGHNVLLLSYFGLTLCWG